MCPPSSSINDPQLPSHAPTAEATERRLLNFCQLPFPSSQMALIKSETEKKPSSLGGKEKSSWEFEGGAKKKAPVSFSSSTNYRAWLFPSAVVSNEALRCLTLLFQRLL